MGGSVRWAWPQRVTRSRTPLRVVGLLLAGSAVAAVLVGTAAGLPASTRTNASPDDPATGSWLLPAWSDQRQLRVAGSSDSSTNVVNAVSRVPQTRGYQANGNLQLDWQVWLEQSQRDPAIAADERHYLFDWHAVGWVLADSRSESLDPYTDDPAVFRPIAGTGDIRAFSYLAATPILAAVDAPTVLVVGDTAHYDFVLRALSSGGIDSSRLVTLQGPASLDDLTPADLAGADTVLLYGATLNDPAAANRLLRDFVTKGGRLVVDDSDTGSGVARLADQDLSVLPMGKQRIRTVTGSWEWRAPVEPLTAGIDLSRFARPSYAASNQWDVQSALELRSWARPLLSAGPSVVAVVGEIGQGESIWSGIGLPYHAASFHSSVEAELIARLLDARESEPAPQADARFVTSERREITVGADARGVLFKERYADGWHARSGEAGPADRARRPGDDVRRAAARTWPGDGGPELPDESGREGRLRRVVAGAARCPRRDRAASRDGGDEGTRTPNPRLAKAVLCQLSHVPGGESRLRQRVRRHVVGRNAHEAFHRDGLSFDVSDRGPRDSPAVVCLHGFPQDSTAYDGVAPLLVERGMRVLAPDQRGYSPGARPTGRSAYALPELVADVLALLDAAGIEAAHVVGHDWGGAVAWALAGRPPDRVCR